MTEAIAKVPTPSEETEKIIIPIDDEKKLEKKELVGIILGYASLIFLGLSLIFPYWNDFTVTPTQYISLWQRTVWSGVPLYHWEVIWYWQIYGIEIILSIFILIILISFILLIVKHIWKRTFPGTGFFWMAILLGIACGFGFPFTYGFDFGGPLPPIYGPTWGFAFSWWALLICGILAIIRQKYLEMLQRDKKEKEESFY